MHYAMRNQIVIHMSNQSSEPSNRPQITPSRGEKESNQVTGERINPFFRTLYKSNAESTK